MPVTTPAANQVLELLRGPDFEKYVSPQALNRIIEAVNKDTYNGLQEFLGMAILDLAVHLDMYDDKTHFSVAVDNLIEEKYHKHNVKQVIECSVNYKMKKEAGYNKYHPHRLQDEPVPHQKQLRKWHIPSGIGCRQLIQALKECLRNMDYMFQDDIVQVFADLKLHVGPSNTAYEKLIYRKSCTPNCLKGYKTEEHVIPKGLDWREYYQILHWIASSLGRDHKYEMNDIYQKWLEAASAYHNVPEPEWWDGYMDPSGCDGRIEATEFEMECV